MHDLFLLKSIQNISAEGIKEREETQNMGNRAIESSFAHNEAACCDDLISLSNTLKIKVLVLHYVRRYIREYSVHSLLPTKSEIKEKE